MQQISSSKRRTADQPRWPTRSASQIVIRTGHESWQYGSDALEPGHSPLSFHLRRDFIDDIKRSRPSIGELDAPGSRKTLRFRPKSAVPVLSRAKGDENDVWAGSVRPRSGHAATRQAAPVHSCEHTECVSVYRPDLSAKLTSAPTDPGRLQSGPVVPRQAEPGPGREHADSVSAHTPDLSAKPPSDKDCALEHASSQKTSLDGGHVNGQEACVMHAITPSNVSKVPRPPQRLTRSNTASPNLRPRDSRHAVDMVKMLPLDKDKTVNADQKIDDDKTLNANPQIYVTCGKEEEQNMRAMVALLPRGVAIHLDHFSAGLRQILEKYDENCDGLLTGHEIERFLAETDSNKCTGSNSSKAHLGGNPNSKHFGASMRDVQIHLHAEGTGPSFTAPLEEEDGEIEDLISTSKLVQAFVDDSGVVHYLVSKVEQLLTQKLGSRKSNDALCVLQALQSAKAEDFVKVLEEREGSMAKHVAGLFEECAHSRKVSPIANISGVNAKFAHLDEATYGTVQDFLEGVNAVGLPHVDPMEGMKHELVEGPDKDKIFEAMNSQKNITTPKTEWNFVVHPFTDETVSKDRPPSQWEPSIKKISGGRHELRLEIFMHAASATGAHGEKFGNFEEAAKLNRHESDGIMWLHESEVGFVKVAVLRFARSQLRQSSLGEALHCTGSQDASFCTSKCTEHAKQIGDLELGLKELGKILGKAACTWDEVVEVSTRIDWLNEDELEAVIRYYHAKLKAANLTEAEIIALRLYTGPMFQKFNTVLRLLHKGVSAENRYVNSIHCTLSALTKLSKQCVIPKDRKLYRGIAGRRLPESFLKDRHGTGRGGMEWAFLSCTTNIDVAIGYLGSDQNDLAIIFEFEVGCIDRGSALSWVSQYPEEDEILMGPMCFLEVCGDPYFMHTEKKNAVIVVPAALNCNQGTVIEKIEGNRKREFLRTRASLAKELDRELDLLHKILQRSNVLTKNALPGFRKAKEEKIAEFKSHTKDFEEMDLSYFNEDEDYQTHFTKSVTYRRTALAEVVHRLIQEKNGIGVSQFRTARDEENNTLMHQGIQFGLSSIMDTFVKVTPHAILLLNNSGLSPLHLASSLGRYQEISALFSSIQHSKDANSNLVNLMPKDCTNWSSEMESKIDELTTPLHAACGPRPRHKVKSQERSERNLAKVVKTLITHKADILAKDSYGWTPLHLASQNGRSLVTDVLLEEYTSRKLNPYFAKTKDKKTALHLACEQGHVNIVEKLYFVFPKGAVKEEADIDGYTPWQLAVNKNREKVIAWIRAKLAEQRLG